MKSSIENTNTKIMQPIPFELPIILKDTKELMTILEFDFLKKQIDWKLFWSKVSSRFSINTLISSYGDYVDWDILSSNDNILWNMDLLSRYESQLNWNIISYNSALDLTEKLIDNFLTKWKWKGTYSHYRESTSYSLESLSLNPSLPLSIDFIKKYSEYLDWIALGQNQRLIIENYDPYDYENNEIYERNIDILIFFKNKWRYARSYWEDDNYWVSGYNKDSIFNNPSINWKREELRIAFKDEIENYNKVYNQNI